MASSNGTVATCKGCGLPAGWPSCTCAGAVLYDPPAPAAFPAAAAPLPGLDQWVLVAEGEQLKWMPRRSHRRPTWVWPLLLVLLLIALNLLGYAT